MLAAALLGGCATEASNPDPFEKSNRDVYQFNDCVDRAVLKPISDGYVKVIPPCVRTAIGSAFKNLAYLDVILNDFLQGKCQQGGSDSARMAVNSTVGLLGFFDVATKCGLPGHENDFGITLGKWGAPSGAYLVLPLLGPSSGRDVWSIPVTVATNPLVWIDMPWGVSVGLAVLDAVDTRARLEPTLRLREQAAIDSYVFTRDAYLQYRRARLAKETGKPPEGPSIYDEEEPAGVPASQPATAPATRPAE
jgi:phospholipid-binding lipoprotein MlaA